MKLTFKKVSKKCPWRYKGECEAVEITNCEKENCAVWQMIKATRGANNEDK